MKLYTAEELKKKYNGKYLDTYPHYDYKDRQWGYEVRGISKRIKENFNLPEDCLAR